MDRRMSVAHAIQAVWPAAQQRWSRFLQLAPPIDTSGSPSIAQIDLVTRQVGLNHAVIADKQLEHCVEALLAHEIGHHVRYPGTWAVHARLRLLEKSVLPLEEYSLLNLFTDLLINARLGADPALRDQFIDIYRAFTRDPLHAQEKWTRDPVFTVYMAVYEELWRLDVGHLMGPGEAAFAERYPDYRAQAQLLAQDLLPLGSNLYAQYLFFASIMLHYVEPDPKSSDPFDCTPGGPNPEDWAEALRPTPAEQAAIERALREGWLQKEMSERLQRDALADRIAGLPGQLGDDASRVPEIMAAWYRREAERWLIRPPAQRRMGEAVVPVTPVAWEPGEPVADIDWITTFVQRGPILGAAEPLRRERIAEYEGLDVQLWQPRMEIYLDVSGSMPDPRQSENAMTLAAQVLTTGTTRAGGRVRALVYSHAPTLFWEWCRSPVEMSRFLMHYIGGGTVFPFQILADSLNECGTEQPIRVIISDSDFLHNYADDPADQRIFADAAHRGPVVLMLHGVAPERARPFTQAGAQVVHVDQMTDFPRMAADLARALFPEAA
jgi:hypothetical protein